MFQKAQWDDLAKRILHRIETDTRELGDKSYEMPAAHYLDEDRWKREIEIVLKQQPLVLALSCELAGNYSYRAISPVGVPILLTRGDDGTVRGFLNKCRHRGASVTSGSEACGTTKRFVCPYHAWTYDSRGALVGLPGKDQFGDIPDDYRHLIPIPVKEQAGIVWGVLTPETDLNLDVFLGDMLPMLEQLGLEHFHFAGERSLAGPNWKIAMDGYIENYHFNVLHRETFGSFLLHDYAVYDEVGPHHRYAYANPNIRILRDIPEADWQASDYLKVSHNIFPNFTLGHNQAADPRDIIFMAAQVWPGATPGESTTRFTFVTPRERTSEQDLKDLETFIEMAIGVVDREDYWVGYGIQEGLAAMAGTNFIYGRMERMVQNFERSVSDLVGAG